MLNTHIDTRTTRGLDPNINTFSRSLAGKGYHMEYFGKWHVHEDYDPLQYGFHNYTPSKWNWDKSRWYDEIYIDFLKGRQLVSAKTNAPYTEEASYKLARSAEEFLHQYNKQAEDKAPFFMRVDFIRPHFPSIVPEPFAAMYDGSEIPPWPNFGDNYTNKPAGHQRKNQEWALQDKDWNWWSKVVAMYYANVSYLDFCCGIILDALENEGLNEETLVVFTSDHADSIGSHNHFEKGGTMYEEVLRIPLMMRWPGKTCAESVDSHFVRNMDLMPTFIRAAGGIPPGDIDAIDLTTLLEDSVLPNEWPDSVFAEYHGDVWGSYTQRMVRTQDYKYIYNPYDLDELYDLKVDPYEMENRIADPDYSEIRNNMRGRLHGWIKQSKDVLTHTFVTRNFPDPIYPKMPCKT